LQSSHVNDEFVVDVHLPSHYDESEELYPVLVVLDGDKSSGMARDIVSLLSWGGEIPELIVVAISYGGTDQEWWDKRSRDLTPTKDSSKLWGDFPLAGGAEAFREFISEELFPFLEDNYRITEDRTLAGLSCGGLFGVYVLLNGKGLFNRFIVVAPALAWDNERILEFENRFQSENSSLDAVVFTAVGELDEPNILEPWERMNQLMEIRDYEGLTWMAHRFEGETHLSCWPTGLTRGLKIVYSSP